MLIKISRSQIRIKKKKSLFITMTDWGKRMACYFKETIISLILDIIALM